MKKLRLVISFVLVAVMLMTSVFSAYAAEGSEAGIEQGVETPEKTEEAAESEEIEEPEEPVPTFTVTWKNADGKTLRTDKDVPYGTMPSYEGTPTKKADAQYKYTFEKWDPEISEVTEDVTYTAVYSATLNSYKVTWANWDETVLEVDENVPYGTMPEYNGETPVKEEDAQYKYAFSGKWDSEIGEVKKDVTYKATFDTTLKYYDITWKNWDGSILAVDSLPYGTIPQYEGDEPVKGSAPEDKNIYSFVDWDPMIAMVTEDAEYTAQFKAVSKYVTITFDPAGGDVVDETSWDIVDGKVVLEVEKVNGIAVIGNKAPQVVRDNYHFDGWYNPLNDELITDGTGFTKDTELKARWSEIPHKVTFYAEKESTEVLAVVVTSEEGWKISTDNFPADPEKEGYSFNGWVIRGTNTKITVDTSFPEDTEVEATWVKTHIIRVTVGEHGTSIPGDDYVIREGETRRFAFNPDDNYVLDYILVNGERIEVTGDSYTFSNVKEDMTLEVFFTGRDFKIVAGEGITPSGNVYVKLGESITFTYNKGDAKYLYIDGVRETDITGSYTFENVSSVHTISIGKENRSSGGGSSGGGSGSGSESSNTVSSGSKNYSSKWFVDTNNAWKIKDRYGNVVINSWVCDNDVFENGTDLWYIVSSDGSMVAADLVRDKNGFFYSFETDPNNRKFGMMRNKSGYYKIGDLRIYLEISDVHDATYGRILNQDAINKLLQTCVVVDFPVGTVVYTANL